MCLKAWTYFCLHRGVQVCVAISCPADIQTTIMRYVHIDVQRFRAFGEKVYAGVQEKIAQESGPAESNDADAFKAGKMHNIDYPAGKTPPLMPI